MESFFSRVKSGHASDSDDRDLDVVLRHVALAEVGDRVPLINGVYADGSIEAARIAAMADREGASALLVFPPGSMTMGGQLRPEMALAHWNAGVRLGIEEHTLAYGNAAFLRRAQSGHCLENRRLAGA